MKKKEKEKKEKVLTPKKEEVFLEEKKEEIRHLIHRKKVDYESGSCVDLSLLVEEMKKTNSDTIFFENKTSFFISKSVTKEESNMFILKEIEKQTEELEKRKQELEKQKKEILENK